MKIKDIMTDIPEFISPDTPIKEAANLMRLHEHGFLPVGENDRLIGTITDRDITVRSTAHGWDPNTTTVREVMSDHIFYCYQDDDINNAAEIMKKNQVHRLVVLNKSKRMAGVISLGDYAREAKNDAICADLLHAICSATRY